MEGLNCIGSEWYKPRTGKPLTVPILRQVCSFCIADDFTRQVRPFRFPMVCLTYPVPYAQWHTQTPGVPSTKLGVVLAM